MQRPLLELLFVVISTITLKLPYHIINGTYLYFLKLFTTFSINNYKYLPQAFTFMLNEKIIKLQKKRSLRIVPNESLIKLCSTFFI